MVNGESKFPAIESETHYISVNQYQNAHIFDIA